MTALAALLTGIKRDYGHHNMPFMIKMLNHAKNKKPYQGMRILHNAPLFLNTLIKIECLIAGGAEVVVTNPLGISHDPQAVTILEQANIPVTLDHQDIKGSFDYILDTSGNFKTLITPNHGAVELTKSGEIVYQSDPPVTYPVINIDNSQVKTLETSLGTGDGLLRALKQLLSHRYHKLTYIVFGYGKVGKGIALGLSKFTDKITIIDKSPTACAQAEADGYTALYATSPDHIYSTIRAADAIITATGIKNIITSNYSPLAFKNKILINMGAEDEFGPAFLSSEILNNKIAINFALKEPTAMKFIDPILYAHNYAIDLIANGGYSAGIHNLPEELDHRIVKEWQQYHHN